MKIAAIFLVILAALVSVKQQEDACGPAGPAGPSHPFNLTYTNRTKELGYLPELTIVKLGARRGIEECQNQLKNGSELRTWKCTFNEELVNPELPIFVNTTLPYDTPETAFLHAISAAAITYEFTLKCRHNIRGCKCARDRSPSLSRKDSSRGCGDNIEFGMNRTKSFFEELEKGNDARTAMNLHNNKVGREVVRSSLVLWCRCLGFNTVCSFKTTCWKILAPFKDIGAELKKKYENAVQVWFKDNRLVEQIGDQFRVISSADNRLVYLALSSFGHCFRNDTSGTPIILGDTCRSDDSKNCHCQHFIAQCNSCGLKPKTVEEFEEVKCFFKLDKICLKNHFFTTCT